MRSRAYARALHIRGTRVCEYVTPTPRTLSPTRILAHAQNRTGVEWTNRTPQISALLLFLGHRASATAAPFTHAQVWACVQFELANR